MGDPHNDWRVDCQRGDQEEDTVQKSWQDLFHGHLGPVSENTNEKGKDDMDIGNVNTNSSGFSRPRR